jgi:hypothetical protein
MEASVETPISLAEAEIRVGPFCATMSATTHRRSDLWVVRSRLRGVYDARTFRPIVAAGSPRRCAMDPITTAIVAAVVAGVTTGGGEVVQQGVVDAYSALKKLITDKFGANSDVADAVTKVEQDPQSQARQAVLAEEVAKAGTDKDPEIKAAADALLEKLGQLPDGSALINQVATGNYIAVAAQHSTATVTVNDPTRKDTPEPKK